MAELTLESSAKRVEALEARVGLPPGTESVLGTKAGIRPGKGN